jgi:hypothetical protein
MRSPLATILACAAAAGVIGCDRARNISRDLLPRTHTVSTSPDGRARAFVRQHLNPDPPDDHLYIVPPGEKAQHVMALAPDRDWCRTIVWSEDSRKVGFLINDERLAVFDADSRELEVMLPLVSAHQEARAVAITSDGLISFDRIEPAVYEVPHRDGRSFRTHASQISQFRAGSRMVTPERVLGRETVRVPEARLLLNLLSDEGRGIAAEGWARLQARDRRQVHLQFASGPDGLVRLPAFDAGPLSIVEIGRRGSQRTTVLRNVDIGSTPVAVTLQ